jgi:hypothetical protein
MVPVRMQPQATLGADGYALPVYDGTCQQLKRVFNGNAISINVNMSTRRPSV